MADRTPVHLTVADCPASQAGAVLNLIDELGLHPEFVNDSDPADDELGLGLTYMDVEISVGTAGNIAGYLKEEAPDASWKTWEDPEGGCLGDVYYYTPTLGLWSAECGAEGEPVFTTNQVIIFYAESRTRDEFETALGRTINWALQAVIDANKGVAVRPEVDSDEEPEQR